MVAAVRCSSDWRASRRGVGTAKTTSDCVGEGAVELKSAGLGAGLVCDAALGAKMLGEPRLHCMRSAAPGPATPARGLRCAAVFRVVPILTTRPGGIRGTGEKACAGEAISTGDRAAVSDR